MQEWLYLGGRGPAVPHPIEPRYFIQVDSIFTPLKYQSSYFPGSDILQWNLLTVTGHRAHFMFDFHYWQFWRLIILSLYLYVLWHSLKFRKFERLLLGNDHLPISNSESIWWLHKRLHSMPKIHYYATCIWGYTIWFLKQEKLSPD